jgi:hypothetical protein
MCTSSNTTILPKLIKCELVKFDAVYILSHFNIILKHNGISSTKIMVDSWNVQVLIWAMQHPVTLGAVCGTKCGVYRENILDM